jgi:hypothetical protein
LEKLPYLADKCCASRNNYKLGPFLTKTPRCLGFLVFHILWSNLSSKQSKFKVRICPVCYKRIHNKRCTLQRGFKIIGVLAIVFLYIRKNIEFYLFRQKCRCRLSTAGIQNSLCRLHQRILNNSRI